jgi:hypothetical protein
MKKLMTLAGMASVFFGLMTNNLDRAVPLLVMIF